MNLLEVYETKLDKTRNRKRETDNRKPIIKMKKLPIIICAFILSINSYSCMAWGAFGHELVGDIAKVYVNKAAADSVQKYLGDMTWAKAAVWMDEVRSDHSYDYLKPMHYIDIDEGKEYEKND